MTFMTGSVNQVAGHLWYVIALSLLSACTGESMKHFVLAALLFLGAMPFDPALAQGTPPAADPTAPPPTSTTEAAPAQPAQPPAQSAQPTPPPVPSGPVRVRFDTSMGSFVVRLERERAPRTVEAFLGYVREGFYDGTIFHRVINNFVAQGGGYDLTYKIKPVKGIVVNESGNGLTNRRGTMGYARAEGPHSGTSQFYLNLADNPDLNPLPTRWGYAVFGEVVEGMEVVDRIGHAPTGKAGPLEQDAPLKPIVIERVRVLE
jgi:peptidyl-prolyl cis-trans isomerase A (cyclophilin A)